MNEYGGEECQPINCLHSTVAEYEFVGGGIMISSILRFNRFWLVFYFHVDADCRPKLPWWFLDKRSRSKILTFRTDQIFRERSGRAQQVAKRHLFTNQCQWTHISRIPITIVSDWSPVIAVPIINALRSIFLHMANDGPFPRDICIQCLVELLILLWFFFFKYVNNAKLFGCVFYYICYISIYYRMWMLSN